MKIFQDLANQRRKYILSFISIALCGHFVFGLSSETVSPAEELEGVQQIEQVAPESLEQRPMEALERDLMPVSLSQESALEIDSLRILRRSTPIVSDSLRSSNLREEDSPMRDRAPYDPLLTGNGLDIKPLDSLRMDSDSLPLITADSVAIPPRERQNKSFLDELISGDSQDSLIYDAKNNMAYLFQQGNVSYQDMNLKADYMEVNMNNKNIYAHGVADSLKGSTRPEFMQGQSTYTMDTINYNIKSEKAKIKGVATNEGEGYITAREVKKMNDEHNSTNMAGGRYTTCDHEHPHFYLAMTKAKMIPNKKIITGPAYLVMEDVPIYFPMIPFGFFPITTGRKSGFVVPSYGEEYVKGFFLRDGGYYFAISDYIDLTVLGGIYTLGSWQGSLSSRYIRKYKYSGSFNLEYSNDVVGSKGDKDYVNMTNFRVRWYHDQDPKFSPNSQFKASVDFATSGQKKYATTTINDYLNTHSNSSISYDKNWVGTPFSFSTNFAHSQNSRDKTIMLSFPNARLSMSRINPFKRRHGVGKERWYEKISMSYSANLSTKFQSLESELFSDKMFKTMDATVVHSIPVSASFSLFNHLNLTPSFNYNETWSFKKTEKEWDPVEGRAIAADTTFGFYRVYNYSLSVGGSTKLYGMYQFGDDSKIQAIRHVLTPSFSLGYTPDFGDPKYGFYKPIQSNAQGEIDYYSPYYRAPGRGRSMSMSFSFGNTLEMKVRDDKDTSGVKKIKLIDDLSISSSYNFLADSLRLAPFLVSLRTTIVKNFGLNVTATLDPYQYVVVDGRAIKINKFMVSRGGLARLTAISTAFGYTFNSGNANRPAINNMSNLPPPPGQEDVGFFDDQTTPDPEVRRALMSSQYYDFSVPWTFGFNYVFNYQKPFNKVTMTNTVSFNASVTFTEKWGATFQAGYDLVKKKLTPGVLTISRDLHCWQMNFSLVPSGFKSSWSFNISVKSSILKDLKYDKSSSFYDTLYD